MLSRLRRLIKNLLGVPFGDSGVLYDADFRRHPFRARFGESVDPLRGGSLMVSSGIMVVRRPHFSAPSDPHARVARQDCADSGRSRLKEQALNECRLG